MHGKAHGKGTGEDRPPLRMHGRSGEARGKGKGGKAGPRSGGGSQDTSSNANERCEAARQLVQCTRTLVESLRALPVEPGSQDTAWAIAYGFRKELFRRAGQLRSASARQEVAEVRSP